MLLQPSLQFCPLCIWVFVIDHPKDAQQVGASVGLSFPHQLDVRCAHVPVWLGIIRIIEVHKNIRRTVKLI